MFKAYYEKLLVQLAVDFNSTPQELKAKETIITTPELNDGRRSYSEDASHWHQIGIDVLPEYRSQGIGSFLVTLLKNRVIEMGDIPFYGTAAANIQSQNIAIKSGFKPTWVETEAVKIEDGYL